MSADKKMSKAQLAGELAEASGTSKETANHFLASLCEIAYREAAKSGEQAANILINHKQDVEPFPAEIWMEVWIEKFDPEVRKRAMRTVKDTPLRGKISRSRIRAAVLEVSRRHSEG